MLVKAVQLNKNAKGRGDGSIPTSAADRISARRDAVWPLCTDGSKSRFWNALASAGIA